MNELKVISLYKHHYRRNYESALDSHYSCWGYYDGMNIQNVTDMFDSHYMEQLWIGSEKQTNEMSGRYCEQHIGIFRESDNANQENILNTYPFLAVLFIQLKKSNGKQEYKDYEREYTYEKDECQIKTYTYNTFDNADLVVFMYSNSLHFLDERIRELDSEGDILYNYTIYGVSDKYLKQCKSERRILNKWSYSEFCKPCNVIIEKAIYNLSMRIACSYHKDFSKTIAKALEKWSISDDSQPTWHYIKGWDKAQYYKKQGHINYTVVIPESDESSLISLLIDGGPITHQSLMYNDDSLFGVETSFAFENEASKNDKNNNEKEEEDTNGSIDIKNDNNEVVNGWSEILIKKYRSWAGEALNEKDYGTYAVFNGLIRILNDISQYEYSSTGKCLFYIIYPSFCLFDKFISRSRESLSDIRKHNKRERIRDIIRNNTREYELCLNEILYHLTHTEQVYFMIPGTGGSSYAISQKLLIFYCWFCKSITTILNDNNRSYSTIISPVVEEVCQAKYMYFENNVDDDRLIEVTISQRSMSYPANAMIILSHEIAHFVGHSPRKRLYRGAQFCDCVAKLMTECRLARSNNSTNYSSRIQCVINQFMNEYRNSIYDYYYDEIERTFLIGSSDNDMYFALYFNELSEYVKKLQMESTSHIISELICNNKYIRDLSIEEQNEFFEAVDIIDKEGQTNSIEIIANGSFDDFISFIRDSFQEVYSDITSMCLLKCSISEFFDSFQVSEGHILIDDRQDAQILLRKYVVEQVFADSAEEPFKDTEKQKGIRFPLEEIYYNFYKFDWLRKSLVKYALICKEELEKYMQSNSSEELTQVRDAYSKLSTNTDTHSGDIPRSNTPSIQHIYNIISLYNNKYEEAVEKFKKESQN